MRANAAVFEKLFTPLSVTEVEIDEPRPGEVLVKIVASGVCHTDALARDGDMPFPAPGVLGHEGAGVVAAVGDGVTNVSVGRQGGHRVAVVRIVPELPRGAAAVLPGAGTAGDRRGAGRRVDVAAAARRVAAAQPLLRPVVVRVVLDLRRQRAREGARRRGRVAPRPAGLRDLHRRGGGAERAAASSRLVDRRLRLRGGRALRDHGRPADRGDAHHRGRQAGVPALAGGRTRRDRDDRRVRPGADPVAAVQEICGGPADFSMDCAGNVNVLRQAADSVGMRGTVALIGGAPGGRVVLARPHVHAVGQEGGRHPRRRGPVGRR